MVVIGPRSTRDWGPVTIALQGLSLMEKAEPVQVRFTIHLRDQRSMWMQDGCKVYMDFYMTLNGSCFMITWTILKSHFLEVGLTQNQETMALWSSERSHMWFIIVYHVWGHAWIKIHWNRFGWGPSHIWLHTTLEDPWPHYMLWEVCWDGL